MLHAIHEENKNNNQRQVKRIDRLSCILLNKRSISKNLLNRWLQIHEYEFNCTRPHRTYHRLVSYVVIRISFHKQAISWQSHGMFISSLLTRYSVGGNTTVGFSPFLYLILYNFFNPPIT